MGLIAITVKAVLKYELSLWLTISEVKVHGPVTLSFGPAVRQNIMVGAGGRGKHLPHDS